MLLNIREERPDRLRNGSHPAPLNATSTTLYLKDGQGNLVHQAKLKEDALVEDPTSKHGNADVPPFREQHKSDHKG